MRRTRFSNVGERRESVRSNESIKASIIQFITFNTATNTYHHEIIKHDALILRITLGLHPGVFVLRRLDIIRITAVHDDGGSNSLSTTCITRRISRERAGGDAQAGEHVRASGALDWARGHLAPEDSAVLVDTKVILCPGLVLVRKQGMGVAYGPVHGPLARHHLGVVCILRGLHVVRIAAVRDNSGDEG